ncbi:hypothetical protein DOTSEDRAFT_53761 [Dothistroma septosporum NZE10]|uniref:C2H2-type domain-containing protein n=1 Tax=Dothistroma septosporum (strain NZE10 / CBS 128990) TaxID=675120 RepID=N1PQS6_DOTSN|nr:hypothetical protein DOTSEDRAFT_53761 [Dothistroma septosporum NZE10]
MNATQMEADLRRHIGSLLIMGTSKEQWLRSAGTVWDRKSAQLAHRDSGGTAPSVSISSPSTVASPVSAGRSDGAQYACPRCTGKLGRPKVFPRKAELMRHVTHVCEQTIEIPCSEPNCLARLTRTDHFKEHLRKVHHLLHQEIQAKAEAATPITLTQHTAIGCGFCRAVFVNNPEGYGNHIAAHFKDGVTIAAWSHTTQVLSLLYQSEEVWRAWMQVLDDQLPGVADPERHISFTKETAASFVEMLEKGLDAETIRPGLWRLFFVGTIGEQMLDDQLVAHCGSHALALRVPATDASSADSGYGASSGQTSVRTVESGFLNDFQPLEDMSVDAECDARMAVHHRQQHLTPQQNSTATMNIDSDDVLSPLQSSWYDDTDHDVPMHDTYETQSAADVQTQHAHSKHQPPSNPEKTKSHRRSASEKLRGMWNEARRSLGLAGPSDA